MGTSGLAQEALEAAGGRGVPAGVVASGRGVEIGARRERLDEQQPRVLGIVRAGSRAGRRWVRGFRRIRGAGRGGSRGWLLGSESVDEVGGPFEEVAQERGEIGESCGDFAVGVLPPRAGTAGSGCWSGDGVPVQDDLRIDQGRPARRRGRSGWR